MTSRKRVSISANDNAKIKETIVRIDGKINYMTIEGKIDIIDREKSDLRKLTPKEKHDYMNSVRTMISYGLGLTGKARLIEETAQAIFNEYEKMRVRSHLKSNTPKRQEISIEDLSSELRVDDEVVADVIKTDFEEEEYQHAWLENVWLDGEYIQVFHIVDGFKGLRIVE